MNAIVTSLSELVKMLVDAFRLPALFPALLFVMLNQFFILPSFRFLPIVNEIAGRDLQDQAFISGALAILLSYIISAIEVPIIRLYEGHVWKDSWWGQFLTGWHLERRNQLQEQHDSDLDDSFPTPAWVLPTQLGNVIAAFEAYPRRRYCMDGVLFWPRMLPILDKHEFTSYITGYRSTLDFLLNASFLIGIFGIECLFVRILFESNLSWWLPLLSLIAAFVFYRAAISSACDWGEMFRAAFDLFRYQLAEALGLQPVKSFEEECVTWHELTRFWMLQPEPTFSDFAYKGDWPIGTSKNKEGEK
ncbi:MAG: hypothetical protein JW850_00740 [Thermoflexales bacterium]|nr:hypothetical protein [Thermoflexales bacterium]